MTENSTQLPPQAMLMRLLVFQFALGGVALLLAWAFGIDLIKAPETPWLVLLGWGLLATLPLLLMMLWFERSRARPIVELRAFVEQVLAPLFRGISPLGIFLLALSAGVFEELFFRGLIQGGLEGWLGLWPALLISSLLFGLAHAMTRSYFLITAVMALYLGALYAWTDHLLVPMLVHFLYDWAVFTRLLRKPPASE